MRTEIGIGKTLLKDWCLEFNLGAQDMNIM
jgi:hypothetical protein